MNIPRRLPSLLAALVLLAGAGATGYAATASASDTATAATPGTPGTNPLAGGPWGVYTGPADGVYPAWQHATGKKKRLLAKVALRPRVRWFTSFIPPDQVEERVRDYITTTQAEAGTRHVLVQMAVFRLWPRGERSKAEPLTKAQQRDYRHWVANAAKGIGSDRVALVLEPDLAVALNGWRPGVRLRLAAYAAKVFGALPHTSVYLDASDADWQRVPEAVSMLLKAGIDQVRGFALGATHYSSTSGNVAYGKQLAAALAQAGVPHRHFVVDTADNGRPFTWPQYWAAHPHGDFNNAETCRTRQQHRCDTLGIPPTWHVGAKARGYADGYLWFGRPWLVRQAAPFSMKRTLAVARTTPYAGP